jgi:hypothetical protein
MTEAADSLRDRGRGYWILSRFGVRTPETPEDISDFNLVSNSQLAPFTSFYSIRRIGPSSKRSGLSVTSGRVTPIVDAQPRKSRAPTRERRSSEMVTGRIAYRREAGQRVRGRPCGKCLVAVVTPSHGCISSSHTEKVGGGKFGSAVLPNVIRRFFGFRSPSPSSPIAAFLVGENAVVVLPGLPVQPAPLLLGVPYDPDQGQAVSARLDRRSEQPGAVIGCSQRGTPRTILLHRAFWCS